METTEAIDETLAALMAETAAGDRNALAALFRSEAGRLLAIVRRIVRRPDLAEEVVQETFVSVWNHAGRFDATRGSVRGWMTAMARNRALNIIRDGSRMDHHDPETLAAIGDRAGDADSAYAMLPDRDALRTCLERLDGEKRRSILLAYVVGLTHGEIAAELKAPLGTVKAWIRRGTIALQECLS